MTTETISRIPETKMACPAASLHVGDIRLFDRLAPQWGQLCKEANAEIFLTPDWIRCYVQAFEPETELVVIEVSAGERLLAILPLTRKWIWYRGIHLLELKGAANEHSVRFDVLRVPGPSGEAAVAEIWRCLRDFGGWHVLQLPYFLEGGVSETILRCAANDGFATLTDVWAESPYVPLYPDSAGSVNVYNGTSRHFRHELRRFARLMNSHYGAKPEFARWVNPSPQLLAEFFALEAAGWKGQRHTAIRSTPETESFYREIARVAAEPGVLHLNALKLEGRMIAGCLGVDTNRKFHGMKLTHDECLRRCAPGHLLMQELLKECAARGLEEVSLGGKADEYKKHWTSSVHRSVNGFVFNDDLRSRTVYYARSSLFPVLRKWQGKARLSWTDLSAPAMNIFRQSLARTKAEEKSR